MGSCAFGVMTTDRVKNSDSITFGSNIGSTNNRFVFQMDTWPVCKNTYVLRFILYWNESESDVASIGFIENATEHLHLKRQQHRQ